MKENNDGTQEPMRQGAACQQGGMQQNPPE